MADHVFFKGISMIDRSGNKFEKSIKSVTQAVVTFHYVNVLSPRRGKHVVELHRSYLMAEWNSNSLKVNYSLISDIFILIDDDTSHTCVVISLLTPIRKGRRLCNHIVFQFDAPGYKEGCIAEGFTEIVCGFSGTNPTKNGWFCNHKGGFCVETLLKDQSRLLYPLQDCFLFLHAPPTRISYDKIDCVRFEKHVVEAPNSKYFDVRVGLKTKQEEHLFRRIKCNERPGFCSFIKSLDIKIMK